MERVQWIRSTSSNYTSYDFTVNSFCALPFEIHFCEKRFKQLVCLIYNHINNVSK